MDQELYDVILKVPSNGIHSPWNLHAFRAQTVILPTTCIMCDEFIYPLGQGACCVRCHCYVHRSCTRKDSVICDHFLLGPGKGSSSTNWGVNHSLVENKVTSSSRSRKHSNNTREVIQIAPAVISSGPKLLEKMKISIDGSNIPTPGSEQCVWRRVLRELATDFKISRIASLPSHRHSLQKITTAMLQDPNSFPGRVSTELRNIYVEIVFPLDKDYLLHAREVLSNIACAVFAILPESVCADPEKFQAVVTIVDWAILKRNDGSMYERVWGAAQRLGSRMDLALVSRLLQQKDMYSSKEMESIPYYADIEKKLCRMPCEYATMDKLKRIVQALKFVASSASADSNGDNSLVAAAPDGETDLMTAIQDMNVDADSLMQRFCDVVAYHTLKYEIYWHAECIYVEFMCRDDQWLLGAEGYALVTLQQALRSLCPTAAMSSAAHNEVVVSGSSELSISQHGIDITGEDAQNEHNSSVCASEPSISSAHHAIFPVTASE